MNATLTEKNKGTTPQSTACSAPSVVRKYAPAVDVIERPDAIVLTADVPGATSDGVNVEFERGSLTIEAAVRPRYDQSKTKFLLREYGVGHFQRSFEINEQIDADKIEARIDNGVLTVTLPKAEQVRPRRITVKGQ